MRYTQTHRYRIAAFFALVCCASPVLAQTNENVDQCEMDAALKFLQCVVDCAEDACRNRCAYDHEEAKSACSAPSSAAAAGDEAGMRLAGTRQSGQDGCYFGECPDELNQKIDQAKRRPPQTPPQRREPEPQYQPDPEPEPEPKPEPLPDRLRYPPRYQPPQVQMTSICQTPTYWCVMNEIGPVNSACYCLSVFGLANGVTVAPR